MAFHTRAVGFIITPDRADTTDGGPTKDTRVLRAALHVRSVRTNRMTTQVPPSVFEQRPGTMLAFADPNVRLFVIEEEWNIRRYPRSANVELRLGRWKVNSVQLAMIMLRVEGDPTMAFEVWIDACSQQGAQTLQALVPQEHIDIFVTTNTIERSYRVRNPWRVIAADLLREIRGHALWSPADFASAQRRFNTLYPTPGVVWNAAGSADTSRRTTPTR